jgi:hypothetical protein
MNNIELRPSLFNIPSIREVELLTREAFRKKKRVNKDYKREEYHLFHSPKTVSEYVPDLDYMAMMNHRCMR